jgi:hypothetical protein
MSQKAGWGTSKKVLSRNGCHEDENAMTSDKSDSVRKRQSELELLISSLIPYQVLYSNSFKLEYQGRSTKTDSEYERDPLHTAT